MPDHGQRQNRGTRAHAPRHGKQVPRVLRRAGAQCEHLLVAGLFAGGCGESGGHPGEGVEPVERERGPHHKLPECVASPDVDQFVRQHGPPPPAGPLRRRRRKQDRRPPQASGHRCGGSWAEVEPHFALDAEECADHVHVPKPDGVIHRLRLANESVEAKPACQQRGQRRGTADAPEQKWQRNRGHWRRRLGRRRRGRCGVG